MRATDRIRLAATLALIGFIIVGAGQVYGGARPARCLLAALIAFVVFWCWGLIAAALISAVRHGRLGGHGE